MVPAEPRVGQLYSCAEQSRMQGGDLRSTLPDSAGRVTLIRFCMNRNPDGPHIIDHGPPKSLGSRTPERVEMLRRQSEPLPVYRYAWGGAWEYLGRLPCAEDHGRRSRGRRAQQGPRHAHQIRHKVGGSRLVFIPQPRRSAMLATLLTGKLDGSSSECSPW
jgi:hypothetical protein